MVGSSLPLKSEPFPLRLHQRDLGFLSCPVLTLVLSLLLFYGSLNTLSPFLHCLPQPLFFSILLPSLPLETALWQVTLLLLPWLLGTSFCWGPGRVMVMAGVDGLKSLLQPKWFEDSSPWFFPCQLPVWVFSRISTPACIVSDLLLASHKYLNRKGSLASLHQCFMV